MFPAQTQTPRISFVPPLLRLFAPLLSAMAFAHAAMASDGVSLPVSRIGRLDAVRTKAPHALGQIVLEARVGEGWQPVDVRHFKATRHRGNRLVVFRLPEGVAADAVRVVGYSGQAFPPKAMRGRAAFAGALPPGAAPQAGAGVVLDSAQSQENKGTEVVESDIFKLSGERLFFFNQYRGLQVIDLSQPLTPARTGTLRLPASGEQFYDVRGDGSLLALLGRSREAGGWDDAVLYLLGVRDGVPSLLSETAWDGWVADSRLIGDALYVLSIEWVNAAGVFFPEAVLRRIDVADPENPVEHPALRFPAQEAVLQSDGERLFVATNPPWGQTGSSLHVIGLGGPGGGLALAKSFALKGRVLDSFKIGTAGGALVAVTLVAENWQARETWVETFPLEGGATDPLSRLELEAARGESLHATRLDGDRLYAVTFRNIDPLFVIDLADPADPLVSGVLEIPGWSTFIEPMGERLVTVGVEGNRAVVSLFDVSDAAAPALLSRLPLGPEGSASWSEANYDEKAVQFFPEENLLLAPFQSWGPEGQRNGVQAVAIGRDHLSSAGTIAHRFDARRGAVLGDYFLSISGQELILADRESAAAGVPDVAIPLAWAVDRLVEHSGFLVQVEEAAGFGFGFYRLLAWGGAGAKATLRVTPAGDPDDLLALVDLGEGPVVGAERVGDRLLVGQLVPGKDGVGSLLRTSVFGLGALPEIGLLDSFDQPLPEDAGFDLEKAQLLDAGEGRFAWYLPARSLWWWGGPIFVAAPAADASPAARALAIAPGEWLPPQPSERLTAVLAVFAENGEQFAPESLLAIEHMAGGEGLGRAFAAEGFVYFSFDTFGVERPEPPGDPAVPLPKALLSRRPGPFPSGDARSWLQVVDLRGGTAFARSPVSIPGRLVGIRGLGGRGATLFADATNDASEERGLAALAYDGVMAGELDRMELAGGDWVAAPEAGGLLFVARGGDAPVVESVGFDAGQGLFQKLDGWATSRRPDHLAVVGSYLLASGYGWLDFAEVSGDGVFGPGESYDLPGNLWLDVARSAIAPPFGILIPAGAYGVETVAWPERP